MTEPLSAFGLASDVLLWQAVALSVLSFAVGILGGAAGLALGTMRLPFMLLTGMPPAVAGGTNILVSTVASATGAVGHLRRRRVDWAALLVQGAPATAGALVGGLLAGVAPEALLIGLAGGLVVWQGIELGLRALRGASGSPIVSQQGSAPGQGWGAREGVFEATAGLGIGLLGGAVGLVLGTLRLPALILILHMDPRVAAGTNLAIGTALGIAGWLGHAAFGLVDYPLLVLMGVTAVAGTVYGVRLTETLSRRGLLGLMGAVLLVVGVLLLAQAIRTGAV
ncbi:MAG: sulfite exporter TauE/SafE family protein [Chloroflexi bacterium]|nr:sulfite exporter TauE/SafE family protein [Chloroflexota bacterium]